MQPRRRNTLVLAGIGAAAAVGGALVGALGLQSGSGAADLLSATLPDLQGRPHRLLELRGRPILCNFWASWCAPCREEIPLLIAAKQQYAARGLEVVGIGIDASSNISEFAVKLSINYLLLVAGAEGIELMRRLGNRSGALPYTVSLDRTGAVHATKLGAYRAPDLEKVLAGLLG